MTATLIGSALCSLLFATISAVGAATPTQILAIKLQDASTDSSIAHMRIVVDRDVLKPGLVTLQAENQSKNLIHEVLVVRDVGGKELPLNAKHDRVNETRVRRLGEIGDLPPGKKGKLTLNLKQGTYLLFCNQPGHYGDGMVTKITVAP